uniref:Uncharacterized protein n=1 Tax=Ciona savignyi TaxID=51511 RepID=H2YF22_CIOSA
MMASIIEHLSVYQGYMLNDEVNKSISIFLQEVNRTFDMTQGSTSAEVNIFNATLELVQPVLHNINKNHNSAHMKLWGKTFYSIITKKKMDHEEALPHFLLHCLQETTTIQAALLACWIQEMKDNYQSRDGLKGLQIN